MNRMSPVIFMLFLFVVSNAYATPFVRWDPVVGEHEGIRVYCETVPTAGSPLTADIPDPAATSYDLATIPGCVAVGVRIEVWATSYAGTLESPNSNHIRLTPPAMPIVQEIPGQPQQLIINFE